MLKKIFTIRDQKAESFNTPFFQGTHGEAERAFRQLVNDDKSFLNTYPDDYDLYYIGQIDLNTGKIEALDTPQHIIKAVQCLQKQTSPNVQ